MILPNWYWDTFSLIQSEPWLLENFNQVIYYEGNEEELDNLNTKFLTKRLDFKSEVKLFYFADFSKFLK